MHTHYSTTPFIKNTLNTHNIQINTCYNNYIYANLQHTSSIKISDMLRSLPLSYSPVPGTVQNTTYTPLTHYFVTDLLYRVINDPTKIPYFAGASGRITQTMYTHAQEVRQSLPAFLSNANILMPHRSSSSGTKCIYLVYINSGFSILKNFINAHPEIERNTVYENLINNYRKKNAVDPETVAQTIVVNNIWGHHNNNTDNITIFTNNLDDPLTMLTALLMIHAHYAEGLNTDRAIHQQMANILAAHPNDLALTQILRYYLTEFWELELSYHRGISATEETRLNTEQETVLNKAYETFLASLIQQAPVEFLNNLTDRYNYEYKRKDERRLNQIDDNLNQLYTSIRQYEQEKHILQRKLLSISPMSTTETAEFWDNIQLFKNIHVDSIANTALLITITSPLTFYDIEDAKIVLNNPASSALRTLKTACEEQGINYDTAKAILFDIFINQKYQIYTYSCFKISITSESDQYPIALDRALHDRLALKDNKIWQPHIMRYNCYNKARTEFFKAIDEKQFDRAFGQLVGATQNLTIGDSTVFSHLINVLFDDCAHAETIYDPANKTYVSIADLYEQKTAEIRQTYATEPAETVNIVATADLTEIFDEGE